MAMPRSSLLFASSFALVAIAFFVPACSGSSTPAGGGDSGAPDGSASDGAVGTSDASSGSDGGASDAASGATDAKQDGPALSVDSDGATDGGTPQGSPTNCTAARSAALTPVDKTSTGTVAVVATSGTTKTIFVDASAGGDTPAQETNPRVYIDLAAGAAVPVTDVTATTSTAWDLALKRFVIFTNSGDGGTGMGGAVQIMKDFAAVTSSDAVGLMTEHFFDAQCNENQDPFGAVETTFSSWYDYNMASHMLTPMSGTFIVRGGTGKLYKVAILGYYLEPDGGTNPDLGGTYELKVAAL
jgi:hypothetical protein